MTELEKIYLKKLDDNDIIKNKATESVLNRRWTEVTHDNDEKIDNLIGDIISFYQEEGFRCGFKTAVNLLVSEG